MTKKTPRFHINIIKYLYNVEYLNNIQYMENSLGGFNVSMH